jgi:hypothetical protein
MTRSGSATLFFIISYNRIPDPEKIIPDPGSGDQKRGYRIQSGNTVKIANKIGLLKS